MTAIEGTKDDERLAPIRDVIPLSELAEDAMFSISNLFDDDDMVAIEASSDLDKVRLRYTSADCDDFALAMHALTGWPIVAVTSGRKGPLHRLVRVPDDAITDGGKFVDVMGFVTEAELRKRYKSKDLRFTDAGEGDSCLNEDGELARVVAVMAHLPEAPFVSPEFQAVVSTWLREGTFFDDAPAIARRFKPG